MRRLIFIASLMVLFAASAAMAQDDSGLTVNEMSFCTSIQDAMPVGVDSVFADTVGSVYCFTNLSSDQDTTKISHVWYYQGEEMASLDLTLKGKSWRTWSSKRIWHTWTGEWRVDVVDETGQIIATKQFTIESTTE